MAIVSRFGSTSRRLALACALAASAPSGASAESRLEHFGGHLAIGYTKLFAEDAPGGSFSMAGGFDYPIVDRLRAGVDIGYHLLGSRTEFEGSLSADVDYGAFEALLLLHWTPPWRGPMGRISVGPGIFNARAKLSSYGAAAFEDLSREEIVPGVALGVTAISRRVSPVRVGLEAALRWIPLPQEEWTLATLRVTAHY